MKIVYKTLRAKLAVGATEVTKDIQLERGERIVAAATTNRDPGQLVSLALYENGNQVSAPMDIDFWRKSNAGRYLDGFKPLEHRGGATLQLRAVASTAVANTDLDIEVVFGIIKADESC